MMCLNGYYLNCNALGPAGICLEMIILTFQIVDSNAGGRRSGGKEVQSSVIFRVLFRMTET